MFSNIIIPTALAKDKQRFFKMTSILIQRFDLHTNNVTHLLCIYDNGNDKKESKSIISQTEREC